MQNLFSNFQSEETEKQLERLRRYKQREKEYYSKHPRITADIQRKTSNPSLMSMHTTSPSNRRGNDDSEKPCWSDGETILMTSGVSRLRDARREFEANIKEHMQKIKKPVTEAELPYGLRVVTKIFH